MVLTEMFEEVVDQASHYGSRGLATKGSGTTTSFEILENLRRLYTKPSYQYLNAALFRLNEPINKLKPLEFMLIGIEKVQLFLLANPERDCALTKPNLISYALIELTKTGSFMLR